MTHIVKKLRNMGIAIRYVLLIFLILVGPVTGNSQNKSSIKNPHIEIMALVRDVTKTLQKNDFDALEKYMKTEEGIVVLPCYVNTSGDRPRSFDQINRWLMADSVGARLRVSVRYSKYDESQWKLVEIPPGRISEIPPEFITFAVEGWVGEWSFINFDFSVFDNNWNRTGQWVLRTLCYAGSPGPGVSYSEPPKLPRPGPHAFRDSHALYARIEEIIQFRALDALRAYAIRGVIKEVPCDQSMHSRPLEGKEVPVSKVIEFLKNQTVGDKEITFYGPHGIPPVFESRGWCCAYPIVNFIVRPTAPDSKYEWAGVSYCHSRVPSEPIIIDLPVKSGGGK